MPALLIKQNRNHIKADFVLMPHQANVFLSGVSHLTLLGHDHEVFRIAEAIAAPGLHFHKNDLLVDIGNNIDLCLAKCPVHIHDLISGFFKISFC